MEHLNSVDSEIKFTREDMNENKLPFLNSVIHLEKDGRLNIEVYRKPVHTDQYLLFHSHHPLVHKLGVIRILHHLAENVPTRTEGKLKEHNHIKTTLKSCEYPNWAYVRLSQGSRNNTGGRRGTNSTTSSFRMWLGCQKNLDNFLKHNIPSLLQILQHPEWGTGSP